MNSLTAYISDNLGEILEKTAEHLWLAGISVLIAIVVGMSCGILLTRKKSLATPVIGFANVIQTIPSLALLGFMIPIIGIGVVPAIVALFLYALLPIIRNTFTGIQEVNPGIREAGTGIGMSDWQLLTKVELPLALPTIFAGIRTAAVINIGVATLCALIAAGGLGEFIFTGIALNNSNMILAGAIPAALLALIVDLTLGLIQHSIKRSLKPVFAFLIALGIIILLSVIQKNQVQTSFSAGLPAEFMERTDGWKALKSTYDIDVQASQMDAGLMYEALKNKRVDVIAGYSTDGRIPAYDLKILEDDKSFFPPYYVAPLLRLEILEKYPELEQALNKLSKKIDDETMQQLNYLADHKKQDPKKVAIDFLQGLNWNTAVERDGEPDLVIGGKRFTEQYILAHIFKNLIENYTSLTVGLKLGLGGTQIAFEALKAGEIDLYAEYSGTGFLVLLEPEKDTVANIIRNKEAVYKYVKRNFEAKYNMKWLQPLGFNNTYALMMRRENARELDINSISDLSSYIKDQ